VAKAIIFRTVQAIVKAKKFPAYQANITAYTVACLAWKSGGSIDFERVWTQQAVSPELRVMIEDWIVEIDRWLRDTAKARMPSEWAKKSECWDAIRDTPLRWPEPLPPELNSHYGKSAPQAHRPAKPQGLSPASLRRAKA
jgi:hypothetical protein